MESDLGGLRIPSAHWDCLESQCSSESEKRKKHLRVGFVSLGVFFFFYYSPSAADLLLHLATWKSRVASYLLSLTFSYLLFLSFTCTPTTNFDFSTYCMRLSSFFRGLVHDQKTDSFIQAVYFLDFFILDKQFFFLLSVRNVFASLEPLNLTRWKLETKKTLLLELCTDVMKYSSFCLHGLMFFLKKIPHHNSLKNWTLLPWTYPFL